MQSTVPAYRDLFLNLDKVTHLAACSQSPLSYAVESEIDRMKSDLLEFGNPWDIWTRKVQESRELFAKIINADPDEIAISSSVSSAFSTIMSALKFNGRNGVVVSSLDYPTTNYIALANRKNGARVFTVYDRGGKIEPEYYDEFINDKTKLVSAIHVSSLNGFKMDVDSIIEKTHEYGGLAYVDAYQSVGSVNVDAHKMKTDFLVSGNLKWLLGWSGISHLFIRRDIIQENEPSFTGWFAQKNPFLFAPQDTDFSNTATRFESGTWSIPSVYASVAGMKTILQVGLPHIFQRVRELTNYAYETGIEHGLQPITISDPDRRGGIVSFRCRDASDIEHRLKREKIITAARGDGIRIAPHFYNTEDEVERAVSRIAFHIRNRN
ncbi:MAG: aminotransferase class V-fold PLP-dependent enzyme [Thermoplasmataceae archaeon]|jgi:selenocysteine lyase/cysteine desulfurase